MGTKSYIVRVWETSQLLFLLPWGRKDHVRRKAKERISLEEHISDTAGVECKKTIGD